MGAVDPALSYARPDVEALVWATVGPIEGSKSWQYASNEPQRAPAGWLVAVSMQVDVRARSKAVAYQRADEARRAVLALPWTSEGWDGGVVAAVGVIDGPFWLPDSDNGAPRYVARYEVIVHPRAVSPTDRKAVAA